MRAHCTYRAPVQWQHSTGISFLGVDGAPTLDVVRRFAEAMHYTGQLSFDFAVVAELFEEPLRQSPATIHDLLHVRDVGHGWRDHMPMVWSVATLVHGACLSHHDKVAVLEAMADDVVWNGEPIDGMSAADAATLATIHGERL